MVGCSDGVVRVSYMMHTEDGREVGSGSPVCVCVCGR